MVLVLLGRGLVDLGMTKGLLLSWLMGQPYDVVNAVAASRIVRWKVVLTICSYSMDGKCHCRINLWNDHRGFVRSS